MGKLASPIIFIDVELSANTARREVGVILTPSCLQWEAVFRLVSAPESNYIADSTFPTETLITGDGIMSILREVGT